MKKGFLISCFVLALGQLALANNLNSFNATTGTYDFAAPVVGNRANLAGAAAGTIVYDTTSGGAFYGLPSGVDPTTASNWTQLSPLSGLNLITTGGSGFRLESVHFTSSNIVTQTTTTGWVVAGAGTLTFDVFTSTPMCVCTPDTQTGCNVTVSSPTAGTVSIWNGGTQGVGDGFTVMCVGQ